NAPAIPSTSTRARRGSTPDAASATPPGGDRTRRPTPPKSLRRSTGEGAISVRDGLAPPGRSGNDGEAAVRTALSGPGRARGRAPRPGRGRPRDDRGRHGRPRRLPRARARHAVVTNVRGMPCGEAVADLTGYRRAFAVSFRTPGGFTCARTFRTSRAGGFRCANGPRAYRFRVTGALRPAVRVLGGGFDGTFSVSRCRTRGGRAVALTARAPGLRLTMRASGGRPGTLRLTNH